MKVYLVFVSDCGTPGDLGSYTGLIWASLDKKKAQDFIDKKEAGLNDDGTIRYDDDVDEEYRDYSRYGYQLLEYELDKEEYEYIDGEIE